MSLRERLAAKAVRRTVVQIPLDPPEDLRARAAEFTSRAYLARLSSDTDGPVSEETAGDVEGRARTVLDELAEHYVDLHLHALPSDDWEALIARFSDPNTGDLQAEALPVMVAASCDDADLQDPDWWAEQLSAPGWTFGDREALRTAVLRLNQYAPLPSLGKG